LQISRGSIPVLDIQSTRLRLRSPERQERLKALLSLRDEPAELCADLARSIIQDPAVQLRAFACVLLGKKPCELSLELLLKVLQEDPDHGVRADAAGALGNLEDLRAYDALVRAFYEETEWIVRFSAIVALGNLGDERAFHLISKALKQGDGLMQEGAVSALGELRDPRGLPLILPFIGSESWMMRQKVAQALGSIGIPETLSPLKFLAKDPSETVAQTAEAELARLAKVAQGSEDQQPRIGA
jgi:HEAT repeat protein